ncbi:MAG: hypothetical protein R3E77_06600 [Steroidobacteraceae bacterium]
MVRRTASLGMTIIFISALCACTGHTQDVTQIGALRYTKYWGENLWRWEGGTTFIERETLCQRDGSDCVEDSTLRFEPQGAELSIPPWLIVFGGDRRPLQRFYDVQTGNKLPCENCADIDWQEHVGLMSWSLSGDRAVGLFWRDADRQAAFYLFQFSATKVDVTRIDPQPTHPDPRNLPRLSRDGSTLAWFDCSANCILYWEDLATHARQAFDTHCPPHDYLEFVWEGNTPKAQYYWGAAGSNVMATVCRDAAGNVALPVGKRPES